LSPKSRHCGKAPSVTKAGKGQKIQGNKTRQIAAPFPFFALNFSAYLIAASNNEVDSDRSGEIRSSYRVFVTRRRNFRDSKTNTSTNTSTITSTRTAALSTK